MYRRDPILTMITHSKISITAPIVLVFRSFSSSHRKHSFTDRSCLLKLALILRLTHEARGYGSKRNKPSERETLSVVRCVTYSRLIKLHASIEYVTLANDPSQ